MQNKDNATPHVSIVLPIYNEEGNLPELYQVLSTVLNNMSYDYELICIDDGSTDNSLHFMKSLVQHDNHLKIIQFRKNYGKSAAYNAGFEAAQGDIIVTLDADLQDDPEEIPLFIEHIEQGMDMVVGWRYTRKDSWKKKLPSRFFNWVVAKITGIPLHDFNCPFKAYNRQVLQEIEIYGELHRYIPVLAHAQGFTISEFKIENRPRKHGSSKFGAERLMRGMLDLFTVLFITRFAKRPLHLLGSGGALICSIGALILLVLTSAHFLHRFDILSDSSWNIHERPLLSLGVLLIIVGIQFFSMGLIGELFIHQQGKDPKLNKGYSIKNIFIHPDPHDGKNE